jgi:hypothetical protein
VDFYFATYFGSFSILLPLIAVIIRRKRVCKDYLPLALLIIIGSIFEILGFIGDFADADSSAFGNIYVVIELLLILWAYQKMKVTFSHKVLMVFGLSGLKLWIVDNFMLHSLHSNNSLFRMVAALIIVFIVIDKLHLLLLYNRKPELRDPQFIISMGFLLYFVYKTFVEAFHLFPVPHQRTFYRMLWMILNVINIITNIILALGILCIRPKTKHLMAS